jgi:hypothetical protein
MCLSAGLPPNRWDEFIVTAAYLQNRVPTKLLKDITPFEVYHKSKPNISHLCKIGLRAFVLILNKHNPKIFQCSEECVLIGYSKDLKSYRCYHRASHRVIESFHVIFIESKDDCGKVFRPGVTQGLDDDDIPPASPSIHPPPSPEQPLDVPPSAPSPDSPPTATLPAPSTIARKSSRLLVPSSRLAEASGFSKINAVQHAPLRPKPVSFASTQNVQNTNVPEQNLTTQFLHVLKHGHKPVPIVPPHHRTKHRHNPHQFLRQHVLLST